MVTSVVRPSVIDISKNFSSELLGLFQFHFISRKKVNIFGLSHMTKMAAMPIYGNNLK